MNAPVRSHQAEVAAFALDDDSDITLATARSLLSAAESARADRFVFARDGARFIRGRGALRQRLGAALGCRPEAVPLALTAGGKPYVPGAAIWFNLSHSGGLGVLAISRRGPVGVDLELLGGDNALARDLPLLAVAVLVPAERQALDDLPEPQRIGRFLKFWTAKEARMKLTGEGLRLEPQRIFLRLQDGLPVGYDSPAPPLARLSFIDIDSGKSGPAICCLAWAERQEGPSGEH